LTDDEIHEPTLRADHVDLCITSITVAPEGQAVGGARSTRAQATRTGLLIGTTTATVPAMASSIPEPITPEARDDSILSRTLQ
jgi:hypothetical protein